MAIKMQWFEYIADSLCGRQSDESIIHRADRAASCNRQDTVCASVCDMTTDISGAC